MKIYTRTYTSSNVLECNEASTRYTIAKASRARDTLLATHYMNVQIL